MRKFFRFSDVLRRLTGNDQGKTSGMYRGGRRNQKASASLSARKLNLEQLEERQLLSVTNMIISDLNDMNAAGTDSLNRLEFDGADTNWTCGEGENERVIENTASLVVLQDVNGEATLKIEVSGDTSATYRWQIEGANGGNYWSSVSGVDGDETIWNNQDLTYPKRDFTITVWEDVNDDSILDAEEESLQYQVSIQWATISVCVHQPVAGSDELLLFEYDDAGNLVGFDAGHTFWDNRASASLVESGIIDSDLTEYTNVSAGFGAASLGEEAVASLAATGNYITAGVMEISADGTSPLTDWSSVTAYDSFSISSLSSYINFLQYTKQMVDEPPLYVVFSQTVEGQDQTLPVDEWIYEYSTYVDPVTGEEVIVELREQQCTSAAVDALNAAGISAGKSGTVDEYGDPIRYDFEYDWTSEEIVIPESNNIPEEYTSILYNGTSPAVFGEALASTTAPQSLGGAHDVFNGALLNIDYFTDDLKFPVPTETGGYSITDLRTFLETLQTMATLGTLPADDSPARANLEKFVMELSSLSTSENVIFMDFDGFETGIGDTGQIITPRYSLDGDETRDYFTSRELLNMFQGWLVTSEDMMPFNVNVTLNEAVYFAAQKVNLTPEFYHVVIGGTVDDWYAGGVLEKPAGGVSGGYGVNENIDRFLWENHLAYVFGLGMGGLSIGNTTSHELGHNFGLGHMGTDTAEYYPGDNGWSPIMGSSRYILAQWAQGEYPRASSQEDELDTIAGVFGYRADDYAGNTFENGVEEVTIGDIYNAEYIDLSVLESGVTAVAEGIIETNEDADYFMFELTDVTDYYYFDIGGIDGITDLDVLVNVYGACGELVQTVDPQDKLNAVFTFGGRTGVFYLSVMGTGMETGIDGIYTDYASLGAYDIRVGAPEAIRVNSLLDETDGDEETTTLREAIERANQVEEYLDVQIILDVSGTIELTDGALEITRAMTITGGGITIDGGGTSTVFNINGAENVVIENVNIANGSAVRQTVGDLGEVVFGGGVFLNGGSLTMVDCTITGCTADRVIESTTDPETGEIINTAYAGYGGGAAVYNGSLILKGTSVANNAAFSGGGIVNYGGTVSIFGGSVSDNTAQEAGAGLYSISGTVTVNDSSDLVYYDENETTTFSGNAIVNADYTLEENLFYYNRYQESFGNARGAGAHIAAGTSIFNNATFTGNSVEGWFAQGAGLYINAGRTTVTNSAFSGNISNAVTEDAFDISGAAIYINFGGNVTVQNSSITGNTLISQVEGLVIDPETGVGITVGDVGGAGIYVDGTLTLSDSTVENNIIDIHTLLYQREIDVTAGTEEVPAITRMQSARIAGAGISGLSGSVTISDSTVSSNFINIYEDIDAYATLGGGGIGTSGSVAVADSAIESNAIVDYRVSPPVEEGEDAATVQEIAARRIGLGGGIACMTGNLTITNTTIAHNMAAYGSGVAKMGGTLTVSNTTISQNTCTVEGADTRVINGGGIYATGATVRLTSSIVENHVTIGSGAGVYTENCAVNVEASSYIRNNAATGESVDLYDTLTGGGMSISGGSLTVNLSYIENNSIDSSSESVSYAYSLTSRAGGGGVALINGATGNITRTYFTGNSVNVLSGAEVNGNTFGAGGGIYNTGGALNMSDCEVTGNDVSVISMPAADSTVYARGGGIYTLGGTVDTTLISRNSLFGQSWFTEDTSEDPISDTQTNGGGFYGAGNLVNSLIVQNFMDSRSVFNINNGAGAGVASAESEGQLTINNCTITENQGFETEVTRASKTQLQAAMAAGQCYANLNPITNNFYYYTAGVTSMSLQSSQALVLNNNIIVRNSITAGQTGTHAELLSYIYRLQDGYDAAVDRVTGVFELLYPNAEEDVISYYVNTWVGSGTAVNSLNELAMPRWERYVYSYYDEDAFEYLDEAMSGEGYWSIGSITERYTAWYPDLEADVIDAMAQNTFYNYWTTTVYVDTGYTYSYDIGYYADYNAAGELIARSWCQGHNNLTGNADDEIGIYASWLHSSDPAIQWTANDLSSDNDEYYYWRWSTSLFMEDGNVAGRNPDAWTLGDYHLNDSGMEQYYYYRYDTSTPYDADIDLDGYFSNPNYEQRANLSYYYTVEAGTQYNQRMAVYYYSADSTYHIVSYDAYDMENDPNGYKDEAAGIYLENEADGCFYRVADNFMALYYDAVGEIYYEVSNTEYNMTTDPRSYRSNPRYNVVLGDGVYNAYSGELVLLYYYNTAESEVEWYPVSYAVERDSADLARIISNSYPIGDDYYYNTGYTQDGIPLGDHRLSLTLNSTSTTSFTINQGNNDYVNGENDFSGGVRIYNGTVDRGAYEKQVDLNQSASPQLVTTLEDLVDNTDGVISLREAIEVYDAEYIIFDEDLYYGTIDLTAPLTIDRSLTINAGPSDNRFGDIVINIIGDHVGSVFVIDSNSSVHVTLRGLDISGGCGYLDETANTRKGGAIYFVTEAGTTDNSLTIENCLIHDSGLVGRVDEVTGIYTDDGYGGAIYVEGDQNDSGTLALLNTTIQDNTAVDFNNLYGVGVYAKYVDVKLEGAKILDNTATNIFIRGVGGGVMLESADMTSGVLVYQDSITGIYTCYDTVISGNSISVVALSVNNATVEAYGGGIYAINAAGDTGPQHVIDLEGTTISENAVSATTSNEDQGNAYAGGGGIYLDDRLDSHGTRYAYNLSAKAYVVDDGSDRVGTNVYSPMSGVTIIYCNINDNSASATVVAVDAQENTYGWANAYGGGIASNYGNLTLEGVNVEGNSLTVNAQNGTFISDTDPSAANLGASAFGAGIWNCAGILNLKNLIYWDANDINRYEIESFVSANAAAVRAIDDARAYGGGIYNAGTDSSNVSDTEANIDNASISDNSLTATASAGFAGVRGAGFYNNIATLNIIEDNYFPTEKEKYGQDFNVRFNGNSGTAAGATSNQLGNATGRTAEALGGGLYLSEDCVINAVVDPVDDIREDELFNLLFSGNSLTVESDTNDIYAAGGGVYNPDTNRILRVVNTSASSNTLTAVCDTRDNISGAASSIYYPNAELYGVGIYTVGGIEVYQSRACFNEGEITESDGDTTITGGDLNNVFGGGIYNTGLTISIERGRFILNSVTGESARGGAIYNDPRDATTNEFVVSASIIGCNTAAGADAYGGGIYNTEMVLVIGSSGETERNEAQLTRIYDNSATSMAEEGRDVAGKGGGVYTLGNDNLLITDRAKIYGNDAASNGGGVWTAWVADVTINDGVKFYDNTAGFYGGGLFTSGGAVGGEVNLENIEMYGNIAGSDGGAVYDSVSSNDNGMDYGQRFGAPLSAVNVYIHDNYAGSYGGGFYTDFNTSTYIESSRFENNEAEMRGGAIYNNSGTLTILTTEFIANTASGLNGYGGALCNLGNAQTVIEESLFEGNTAYGAGGAIYNFNYAGLDITATDFIANAATGPYGYGGAIYNLRGNLTMTGVDDGTSVISANSAFRSGGAIYNERGEVVISAYQLANNSAGENGGAIYNIGIFQDRNLNGEPQTGTSVAGTVTLNGMSGLYAVSGNTAGNDGGAIYNTGGAVTVNFYEILNNSAINNGGAIWNDTTNNNPAAADPRTLILIGGGSLIAGNTAGNDGGAIYTVRGDTEIGEYNLARNSAVGDGGAIWKGVLSGDLTLTGSTVYSEANYISNNSAANGGAIYSETGDITVTDYAMNYNTATENGGGVYSLNGDVDFSANAKGIVLDTDGSILYVRIYDAVSASYIYYYAAGVPSADDYIIVADPDRVKVTATENAASKSWYSKLNGKMTLYYSAYADAYYKVSSTLATDDPSVDSSLYLNESDNCYYRKSTDEIAYYYWKGTSSANRGYYKVNDYVYYLTADPAGIAKTAAVGEDGSWYDIETGEMVLYYAETAGQYRLVDDTENPYELGSDPVFEQTLYEGEDGCWYRASDSTMALYWNATADCYLLVSDSPYALEADPLGLADTAEQRADKNWYDIVTGMKVLQYDETTESWHLLTVEVSDTSSATHPDNYIAVMEGNDIDGNSAEMSGGAFYVTGDLSINRYDINENSAGNAGGAVYHSGKSTLSINAGETMSTEDSVLYEMTENTAGGNGGAVYHSGRDVTINRTSVSDNTSGGAGGGLYLVGAAGNYPVSFQWCDISGNTAVTAGGGLYYRGSSQLKMVNSLVSSNEVTASGATGAGIYSRTSGGASFINATIAGNVASGSRSYGGGLYAVGVEETTAVYEFANSILATSDATYGSDLYLVENETKSAEIELNGEYSVLTERTSWDSDTENVFYDETADKLLFVDTANGDYHLIDGSMAYEVGRISLPETEFDLDGYDRTTDTPRVDAGAYQYRGAATTDPYQYIFGETSSVTVSAGEDLTLAIDHMTNTDLGGAMSEDVTTLSLRIHYNSAYFTFNAGADGIWWLGTDISMPVGGNPFVGPLSDAADYDGDASTDQYILVTWDNQNGWGEGSLNYIEKILDLVLSVRSDAATGTVTKINFSVNDLTTDYAFRSQSIVVNITAPTFDVDLDGKVDLATDVNLIIRSLREKAVGEDLISGLLSENSTRVVKNDDGSGNVEINVDETANLIAAYINNNPGLFDIDGDGRFTVGTDDELLIRYFSGYREDALVEGVNFGPNATRTTWEAVAGHIETYMSADESLPLSTDKYQVIKATVDDKEALIAGEQFTVTIEHKLAGTDASEATTLSLRIHYDSSVLTFVNDSNSGTINLVYDKGKSLVLPYSAGGYLQYVVLDDLVDGGGYDEESATDKYILITWNMSDNAWWTTSTNGGDFLTIFQPVFTVNADAETNEVVMNFTAADLSADYRLAGVDPDGSDDDVIADTVIALTDPNADPVSNPDRNYTILNGDFDIDLDGKVNISRDLNLLLRYFIDNDTGENLAGGLIDDTISCRVSYDSLGGIDYVETGNMIGEYLAANEKIFDIDGNGEVKLNDFTLLYRYLSRFPSQLLIQGNISPDATRTTAAEITSYIEKFVPAGTLSAPLASPLSSDGAYAGVEYVGAGASLSSEIDPDVAALLLFANTRRSGVSVVQKFAAETPTLTVGSAEDADKQLPVGDAAAALPDDEIDLDSIVNETTIDDYASDEDVIFDEELLNDLI